MVWAWHEHKANREINPPTATEKRVAMIIDEAEAHLPPEMANGFIVPAVMGCRH